MNLRLKEVLDEKNMSLVTLSEKTGIEKGNLSAISNNKKNPTVETLSKIAKALQISLAELFESPPKGEINGFVEYNGDVYKINSIDKFQEFITMVENKKYEEIGRIANNANGQKIKGSDLAPLIGMVARGAFSAIAAAYRYYYNKGDANTAENIAKTFVNEKGEYAYKK